MKVLTILLIITFAIAGFIFLETATNLSAAVNRDARTPSLIAGVTCLVISTGLLIMGTFVYRDRQ